MSLDKCYIKRRFIIKTLLFFLYLFPSFVFGNCEGIFSSGFNEGPAYSLYKQAMQSQNQAYAPYSNFYVGAALLTKNSNVYCGCNVENSAYGSTQCAEANAVGSMITGGEKEIKEIVLVVNSRFKDGKEILSTPCGNCRQILSEFGDARTAIHIYTPEEGFKKTYTLKELLPESFSLKTKSNLNSKQFQAF